MIYDNYFSWVVTCLSLVETFMIKRSTCWSVLITWIMLFLLANTSLNKFLQVTHKPCSNGLIVVCSLYTWKLWYCACMFCCWDCNYHELSCVEEQICCNTNHVAMVCKQNNVTVKSKVRKTKLIIYSGCGILWKLVIFCGAVFATAWVSCLWYTFMICSLHSEHSSVQLKHDENSKNR